LRGKEENFSYAHVFDHVKHQKRERTLSKNAICQGRKVDGIEKEGLDFVNPLRSYYAVPWREGRRDHRQECQSTPLPGGGGVACSGIPLEVR